MAQAHNESPGRCIANSRLLLLSKRQTDRPLDGLITGGASALQQQGEREKERVREIKKREDPRVWESEMRGSKRGRSAGGLALV